MRPPSPGRRAKASGGMPALCSRVTARWAMSGVCSAGLAITALPAARATTWPVKIARGKFHGLMQAKTRDRQGSAGCARRSGRGAASARRTGRGPAGHSSVEIDGFPKVSHGVFQGLAGLAHQQADQPVGILLIEVGGGLEERRACRTATPVPVGGGGGGGDRSGLHSGLIGFGGFAHHHGTVIGR